MMFTIIYMINASTLSNINDITIKTTADYVNKELYKDINCNILMYLFLM